MLSLLATLGFVRQLLGLSAHDRSTVRGNDITFSTTGTAEDEGSHRCPKSSYTVSGSWKTIGDYTFHRCYEMTAVILESGITSIGLSAFENCKSLEVAILPDTLKTIGARAFEGCESLHHVNLPGLVEHIGERSFSDCLYFTRDRKYW